MNGIRNNWNTFGPKHGLIVIDMQSFFVSNAAEGVKPFIPKLIENISAAIRRCIEAGGPVVIVEFRGNGELCDKISKSAANYDNSTTFIKDDDALLNPADATYLKQLDYFTDAFSRKVRFSIAGVNTSGCCFRSKASLVEFGINARIRAGLSLNTGGIERNFIGISRVARHLSFPRGGRKKSLLDYL